MVLRAYKFQLRQKPAAERLLCRFAGSCRWVWNAAIAEQKRRHAAGEKFAGHAAMCKWLTGWRHAPQTVWLAETPIHPRQHTLKRLEAAYRRFFEKTGGYPRFRGRGQEAGLRFPDPKQFALDQANGRVKLPKLSWLRLRQSQVVKGELRNATVVQECGRWFVSIQVEQPQVFGAVGLAPTLGIDLGVALFAATSDGQRIEPLNALKTQQRRLKHAQRAVSRKVRGSRNRRKAVHRLGRIHSRIARQRNDWLHKLSTELAARHPVSALEDLRIQNLTASARGTPDAPGTNVRRKAGLNRSIHDQAWGEFGRQLAYKTAGRGGAVVAVNPAYTSQTCRPCGHISQDNRPTQARFECLACGHQDNADVNAAKNILAAGHAVWLERADACGAAVSRARPVRGRRAAAVKQEPTEERGSA